MSTFINILAWTFGSLSTVLLVLLIVARATYSDLQKLLDAQQGFQRTFPLKWPGIVAIVCIAWLIAHPLG